MHSLERLKELTLLPDDALVDVKDAAAVVGLKVATLNAYRCNEQRLSPKFHRVGPKLIRYRMGDLREFLAALPKSGG